MNATLTADGGVQIPQELRDRAQLKTGDTLEVHLHQGTLVLRKHEALNPVQISALLERSRGLPAPTTADDAAVEQAVRDVRAQRR